MKVRSIAIVSLSAGTIGEEFVRHEVEIGVRRLEEYGLRVVMMPHAMSGREYIKNHPEDRAADLLAAFQDESIDMILCAIGGDDTYRLLPCLFEHNELRDAVSKKVFLGFSDSTMNHLMLKKVGLNTFYGQSFLADICELESEMLPYSKAYFEELITTGTIREIKPSEIWYEERTDFSEEAIGQKRKYHTNYGFELLQGDAYFFGEILGGCIETIYDIFNADRYPDTVELCHKYQLFPNLDEWRGKILLLETSEETPSAEHYRKMLETLKETGIFGVVNGIICGKPMDERYIDEYKRGIVEVVNDPELPIVVNINVGHATPRCIIPLGVKAEVDAEAQIIRFVGDGISS